MRRGATPGGEPAKSDACERCPHQCTSYRFTDSGIEVAEMRGYVIRIERKTIPEDEARLRRSMAALAVVRGIKKGT